MDKRFFDLEKKANELRTRTLDMCVEAGTGHVTSSMSCAEIMSVLYYGGVMKHDPQVPDWEFRDRFVLSKGQASPILYVVLGDNGYFPEDHLDMFVKGEDGSGRNAPFGVHLQCSVPGVEFTTGSLGHGLGYGAGIAEVAKLDDKDFSTYVLLGDGELYEGSNWEVAMYASHHKLDNLVAIVDRNEMCTNGYTEKIVGLNPIDKKFETFGWETKTVNGHSVEELYNVLSIDGCTGRGKPLAIIAETTKGKGIASMTDKLYMHGIAPKGEGADLAQKELATYVEEHIKNGGYNGSRTK
jgi:transketolase